MKILTEGFVLVQIFKISVFKDSSGLPPDDEDKEPVKPIKDQRDPVVQQKPTPSPPLYQSTIKSMPGKTTVGQWSLDSTTIAILVGVFLLVIFIIVLTVICMRKRSSEFV